MTASISRNGEGPAREDMDAIWRRVSDALTAIHGSHQWIAKGESGWEAAAIKIESLVSETRCPVCSHVGQENCEKHPPTDKLSEGFVTEHHLNEVQKHFEHLVRLYAEREYRNTNTEAGVMWNDAINLARGVMRMHSADRQSQMEAIYRELGPLAVVPSELPPSEMWRRNSPHVRLYEVEEALKRHLKVNTASAIGLITDTDLKHYRNCKRIACCECARVESMARADSSKQP